jgi:hypothetical protein
MHSQGIDHRLIPRCSFFFLVTSIIDIGPNSANAGTGSKQHMYINTTFILSTTAQRMGLALPV